MQSSPYGRPQYNATGWAGSQPTLTFNGSILEVEGWSGAPLGDEAPFTILAVARSTQAQNTVIAGVWDINSGGQAWAGLRTTNGMTLLDSGRVYQLGPGQMFAGSQDLGDQRHVLAWRYTPETQTLSQAVDGTITSSSSQPPIYALPSMPFIIGAQSLLPTGLFQGDLSELVVVPASISDEDILNFTDYARSRWDGIAEPDTGGPCLDVNGDPATPGTRCDDGDAATYGDHCEAGACLGAVPAAGSPAELSPTAWYRAGTPEVVLTYGGVSMWFDRTSHHLDLQQAFYAGRPTLDESGWPGDRPTLHFNNAAIWRHAWTAAPAGYEAAFSVLAVFRSGVSTQDTAVAGFWHGDGGGQATCRLKHSNGMALALGRRDVNGWAQDFTATTDLGDDIHVAVWRYSHEVGKLTLDGSTVTLGSSVTLAPLVLDSFLIGAGSYLPTEIFTGDVAEVAVVPRSISDAEVYAFDQYAHDEWGVPLQCTPQCSGVTCGEADGCGGTCACAPACDLNAPFDPPVPAFTGTTIANGLTFSQDGLTAYVSAKASPSQSYRLNVASRASREVEFGPLTPLGALNYGSEDRAPSLSDDGRSLYFTAPNSSLDLFVATRTSPEVEFSTAHALSTLNTSFHDQDPFFLSSRSELYFASESPSGIRDLYVSTVAGDTYSTPVALSGSGVNMPQYEDYRPVLSRDGLTLYFSSSRAGIGGDTQGDVWIARRSAIDEPFGEPTNLVALNSSTAELPVTLADGGCTLYFASGEYTGSPTNLRLYRATRGSSTPAAVTTTLQIIGSGSVDTPPFQCPTTCAAEGAPDSTMTVVASGPAFWTGSCTGNNGNPSSDGILVFTNGGVCTVNFQSAGGAPGGPGDPCFIDGDCIEGLSCELGVCSGDCCAGKSCGDVMPAACGACPGLCANGDPNCHSDAECPQGSICAQGVGDRYGQLPAVPVCMPVGCLPYNPELPNCGVSDPACGDCLPPPVSTYCGDAIRDPVSEECDDGPGTGVDACSGDCHLTEAPVAPLPRVDGERRKRSLDLGRHPLSSTLAGTLVAYTELDDSSRALRGALLGSKGQPLATLDLGVGAFPSEQADASVAAIEPNRFVVAWNDLDQGSLDVALRVVSAGSSATAGSVVLANVTTAGAQQDPDLIWTGSELIVAWASELAIVSRRFGADLVPIGDEQQLSPSGEPAGSVALASFGSDWAAAWRATTDDGGELVRVHGGGVDWSVGPFLPGAEKERPALIELDASNLLVVFSEGTDPLDTGTPALTRLRGALLNVGEPGLTDSFPLQASNQVFSGSDRVAQSRPTLGRVGTKLFLGWETGALTGDAFSSEVWLQELTFDSSTGLAYGAERPIPAAAGRQDAQRAPAFAESPLLPEGALAIAWEQHAESWPYGARPDVVFALRPVPFVGATGCTLDADCAGTNQFCENGSCQTRSCNLTDAFGSITRALPGITSTDGMTLAADGLSAYFSRRETSDYDLYVATRGDTSSAFGALGLVPNVNGTYGEHAPSLSPDGLQLFFDTGSLDNGLEHVVVSSRTSPGATFGAPELVANVTSAGVDEHPYLSLGGQALLFASAQPSEDRLLYAATKTGAGFDAPVLVPLSHVAGWDDTHPVLSNDGLRLYFESARPGSYSGDTDGDIWMVERANATGSFETPVNLTTLNGSGVEFPVMLAADGCSLYFASNREHGAGGVDAFELYQATRQPTPSQVTVQLNVTGAAGDNVGSPYSCASGNTGTCAVTQPFGSEPIVYASRQATWSGACRPNGLNPSTDGIVLFGVGGVCNVAFP